MNEHAEVNGDTALPDTAAVTVEPLTAAPENSSPNTFAVRGFQKGFDPRRNLAGRIAKKPTVLDETKKLAERKRKQVAQAHVNRMMREDATGNRAWAEYRDTFYGMPKQTLVLEAGESGADSLDAAMAAYLAERTVDSTARELP